MGLIGLTQKPLWASSFLLYCLSRKYLTTPYPSHSVHKQITFACVSNLSFSNFSFLFHVKFRDSTWQLIAPFSLKQFFTHFSVSTVPWFSFCQMALLYLCLLCCFLSSPQPLNIGTFQGTDFFPSLFSPLVISSRLVTSNIVCMLASQIYVSNPDLSTDVHNCIFKYLLDISNWISFPHTQLYWIIIEI